ncbi:MAG: mechanosensitive ion channel [Myxococcales bacterium]|nr:mechanosensitive ion channel [Myxococcales bacterium]
MSLRAQRLAGLLAALWLGLAGAASAQAPSVAPPTPKPPAALPAPKPPAAKPAAQPRDAALDASADAELEAAPSASAEPEPAPIASAVPEPSAAPEPEPSASAVPEPSAPPSAAPPLPSASAEAGATVRVGDVTVFQLLVGHGSQTAKARAEAAAAALKEAISSHKPEDVRVEERGEGAAVYAGKVLVIELYPEDASAAGELSVKEHAARVATQIREAMRREQKRSAIATTVFSLSLVVLALLFAVYLLRKLGEFTERARDYIVTHPDRIPALRIYSLEVVQPAALRSALVVGFGALRFVAQVSIIYLWLLGSLSLFETTRPYTEKLTGLVISPITGLLGRVVATIPMLVVTALTAVAVLVVLRFVAMFFGSVARGETRVAWLPAELAGPTSLLLRMGIVAAALVFAAPVVTGDSQGALARAGTVVVAALGLAATPLLATALAGAAVLYSGRLSPGDSTRVGARSGRVKSVGLLDVQLESDDGSLVRIPHLLLFFQSSELLAAAGRVGVEIVVSAEEKPGPVEELLAAAAARVGDGVKVQLLGADADGLRFRVSVDSKSESARGELLRVVLEALSERGVRLGRGRGAGGA